MDADPRPVFEIGFVKDVAIIRAHDLSNIFEPRHVQEFTRLVDQVLTEQADRKLLISLAGVQYLSSAMLAELIKVGKRVGEAGGEIRLCSLSRPLQDIFRVTQLRRSFQLYDTEEEALESF